MKRIVFTFIALGLMVVLGVGMASAAQTTVPAGVEIGQYIELTVENVMGRSINPNWQTGENYVKLLGPGNANQNAIGWPVSVRSNAGFSLRVEEDVSSVLAQKFGADAVWAFNATDYLIAPNVEIFESDWSRHLPTPRRNRGASAVGRYEEDNFSTDRIWSGIVQFNAAYRLDAPNDTNFTILDPGLYMGIVTITASPATP